MKLMLITFLAISHSLFTFADGPPFEVTGGAKLIASWNPYDDLNKVSGKLSSGDEIVISNVQNGITVQSFHRKLENNLWAMAVEGYDDLIMVNVYEYDFDNDGEMELMVVYSTDYASSFIQIFRYSNGLKELIGDFMGQSLISLEANLISLPYGSQGLVNEFIYRNGSFYELTYHNPLGKD
jgi:hypothetical protein